MVAATDRHATGASTEHDAVVSERPLTTRPAGGQNPVDDALNGLMATVYRRHRDPAGQVAALTACGG
jgi:hypothetical protein